jgi:LEA14-like dessication related protein
MFEWRVEKKAWSIKTNALSQVSVVFKAEVTGPRSCTYSGTSFETPLERAIALKHTNVRNRRSQFIFLIKIENPFND